MKDIYELLNNAEENFNDLKNVRLSEFEKRKIFEQITVKKHRKNHWKGIAAAAVILILTCVGVSPAVAAIWSYFNENTTDDYLEEIQEEVKSKGTTMEVLSVSKNGENIKFKCRFVFDRDISVIKEECAEFDVPAGNVLSAPPFQNSTILVNGFDLKGEFHVGDPGGEYSLVCRNTLIEDNTIIQSIDIGGIKDSDEISLQYRNIVAGGEVITGEWEYNYIVQGEVYPNEELSTENIGVSGTGVQGNLYTMDSFAVTPNGLKIFGTSEEVKFDEQEEYPRQAALIRIIAHDNLGNEYLMYPKYPSEDGVHAVYTIYNGAADLKDKYLDEWDTEASSITVQLQEEVLTWTSETECSAEYPVISDEFTIDLTGQPGDFS